jgi:hypothetical protein
MQHKGETSEGEEDEYDEDDNQERESEFFQIVIHLSFFLACLPARRITIRELTVRMN